MGDLSGAHLLTNPGYFTPLRHTVLKTLSTVLFVFIPYAKAACPSYIHRIIVRGGSGEGGHPSTNFSHSRETGQRLQIFHFRVNPDCRRTRLGEN